jgi:hypothetical protein
MKKIVSLLVTVVGLSFLLSGCGGAKIQDPKLAKAFDDKAKLYTTRNMHYNIGRRGAKIVEATNYQVGILIPVNSEVTMDAINRKQIAFIYRGQKIILRNIPKYTGLDIGAIAKRYFSMKKVDLSQFTKQEQKAIKSAQVVNGMSKKAVIVSLGTPPAHVTPNLDMDQWKYWRTRFSTFFVTFENGKVISNPKTPSNGQHQLSIRVN